MPFFAISIRLINKSKMRSFLMQSRFRIFLLALYLFHHPNALAEPQEWWIEANTEMLHFNYREFGTNENLLNKENGFIPGLELQLGKNWWPWQFAAMYSRHADDVTYTGQTNTGIAISTTTQQQITRRGFRIEYLIDESIVHSLHLGASLHRWRRDIQPTVTSNGSPISGLLEIYQWWQFNLGTKATLYKSGRHHWMLNVCLSKIYDPNIAVLYSGLYDDAHLDLADRWGMKFSLPWSYSFASSTTVLIEPYATRHEFGRSSSATLTKNSFPIGTIQEPGSATITYGISIGFHKDF